MSDSMYVGKQVVTEREVRISNPGVVVPKWSTIQVQELEYGQSSRLVISANNPEGDPLFTRVKPSAGELVDLFAFGVADLPRIFMLKSGTIVADLTEVLWFSPAQLQERFGDLNTVVVQ